MVLSFALALSMLAEPAAPAPPAGHETMLNRHHLLYGRVIPGPTDAPHGVPGEPYVCLSCHAIDTSTGTNQFVIERDCHACHDPDRHHRLYGSVIPYPTDAPYGAPGDLYVCLSCHAIDTSGGSNQFLIERDCQVCHDKPGIKNVIFDIKPRSVKNPINPKSRGVLRAAILGSDDYDVSEIDVSSLLLEGEVPPLRARLKKCGDGYQDLKLKFSSEAVWDALGDLQPCQTYEVWITGTFNDGTQLLGSDSVFVVPFSVKHGPKKPKNCRKDPKAKKKGSKHQPQKAEKPE
jgi:hypothetical protein